MLEKNRQEAIEWFLRLRSPEATRSDLHNCNEWLSEENSHYQAYIEISNEWVDLEDLSDWAGSALNELNLDARTRSRSIFTYTAATFATAFLILLFFAPWQVRQEIPSVRYQTAKAEQRQFTLEDGSRLHLNTASSVEVRFNSGSREVTLTEGESMFDVAHDPSRPFMVRAGNNNVIALGTRFSVHLENGNVEVTVLEGRVAVVPLSLSFSESASLIAEQSSLIQDSSNSENTDTFILEPDRQLRIDANGQLESLLEVNAVERTSWQEGQLIFEGTPLRQVVSEISRYVPGQIRVADNVLDFPVTGVIQIRNPAAMLELLSMVVPVVPIRESATITMLYNQP